MSRGKREKKKTPTLHSYFLSLLSLVLCCAMFMSATMAWFTSEVETGKNQILVGTLSVQLQDAEGASLNNSDGTLFQTIIYQGDGEEVQRSNVWQSGAAALERFNIVNTGDLGFDYNLYFIVSSATLNVEAGDASIDDVTDHFTVWVRQDPDDDAPQAEGASAEAAELPDLTDGSWQQVKIDGQAASLTEILALVTDEETGAANPTPILSGSIPAEEGAKHGWTVALVMEEDGTAVLVGDTEEEAADLSIMGRELQLSVRLVANQQRSAADGPDAGE